MLSDTALLVSGTLTLESLVCLRAGEWARDDSRKALRPLEGERIKIAGPGGRVHPWRCLYYREGVGCGGGGEGDGEAPAPALDEVHHALLHGGELFH